jgi:hypothetical protein
MDDAMLIVEVRRDVDGAHISEEGPEEDGVGVDDPVDGGLVVWGVSLFRDKRADVSDGACGNGAPRGVPVDDNEFETVPAIPDGEIENI